MKCDECKFGMKHNCYQYVTRCLDCEQYGGQMNCKCDDVEDIENCQCFKPILTVGTKFKGKINNELFEIVDEYTKDRKVYFKIKHLKNGKTYEFEKKHLKKLLIEIIESEENNNED